MNLNDQQIIKQEIESQFELVCTDNENISLKINGFYTSSRYNPRREAERLANAYYKKNYCHIIIGFGTGYIVEELYKKINNNDYLIIIEPNKEAMAQVLKNKGVNSLKDLYKIDSILGVDINIIAKTIEVYASRFNNRLQVVINPNYDKIYPHTTKKILETIKKSLLLQVVNKNTLILSSEGWQKNYISNLYSAFTSIPFPMISKSLESPIIITSGGPSLIQQLPLLKKIQDKVFILCAGTTINTLLAYGITPHAVISIDGGEVNFQHFKDIDISSMLFFYSMKVHHKIPENHSGVKIVFNIMGERINEITNRVVERDLGSVFSGFSVANSALDIAFQLTSGPIALVGQDLAYTDNQSHATGNKNRRIIDETYIKERNVFEVEGYYGDRVLTDFPLDGMNRSFVQYLDFIKASNSNNRIFNCTEGGALIKGMENMPFADFISLYCTKDISYDKLINLTILNNKKETKDWLNFYLTIKNEKDRNNKLIKISNSAKKLLESLDNENPEWNDRTIQSLDKLDEELKIILKNDFLYYLYNSLIYHINNSYLEEKDETKAQRNKRIFLKSVALYDGLYNTSLQAEEWLELLLEKIRMKIEGEK